MIDINRICGMGELFTLIKLQKEGHKFKYDRKAINWASMHGYVHILEWFKNSGYKLKYNKNAINSSSIYKRKKNLKWFKNNNYKTRLYYIKKYTH
jgi:hypothetical protein